MATTNPEYGKNIKIKIGAIEIANLVSHSSNKSSDTRTVTTKDSNDWEEVRPTIKRMEIPFSGLYSKDSAYGYSQLDAAWRAGTAITWREGSFVSGEPYETGTGYIVALDKEMPFDGNVEFSGTIKITGEATIGVEA